MIGRSKKAPAIRSTRPLPGQEQFHRVGAHHAAAGVPDPSPGRRLLGPWTCSTFPHIKAAASLTRKLAFPHQADHRDVQLAPPAGASNSFHPVASSAPRHAGKGVNGGTGDLS